MDPVTEHFSILLIDSDETSARQIREALAQHPKYPTQFDRSKTPEDALKKLEKKRYHLILASQEAENKKGVEGVLNEINRRKLATPFVLLVSPGEVAQAHGALKAGAADYLIRSPDEIQKLSERIWSIYRNYELNPGPAGLEEEIDFQSQKLVKIDEGLRQLSIRDKLTGLYNHRHLQEKLAEEFTRAVRYHHPLSCLMVDLDRFRLVNDEWGHRVGDEVLKETAELLLESSRLSDLIARFGGEEFVILLPHVDYQGTLEVAERLREMFANHTFLSSLHPLSFTVSIGIASFPEDPIKDRANLIEFAEQALFRAKMGGRNQIVLYRTLLPTIREALPHLKISEAKIFEFQKKLSEIADRARQNYIESTRAMIMALEAKDPFTAGHSARTAQLAKQVAEAYGLSLDDAEVIGHAGLLHDIGKICITDQILLKPARLAFSEYEAMKQHPYFGYRILKPIKFLHEEANLVLHHHEWFDGEGYPCQLCANEIPLGSRIVAVVDSYDTMRRAGGRYKPTMSVEEAANELILCAGTQFDPEVVQAFIQVLVMRKELSPEAYDRKRLREAVKSTVKK